MKNNKDSFKMIINDKNYELDSFFKIKNEKENEVLKIKLKQIKSVSNLSWMFSGCFDLIEIPEFSKLDMNNINNMKCMFNQCSKLSSLACLINVVNYHHYLIFQNGIQVM